MKYRVGIQLSNGKDVLLGKYEENPEYALHCYEFDKSSFTYYDEDTQQERRILQRNHISISILVELMAKIGNVFWKTDVQRSIAETNANINQLSPSREWLDGILQEDGMVDVFRHYYSDAKAR